MRLEINEISIDKINGLSNIKDGPEENLKTDKTSNP